MRKYLTALLAVAMLGCASHPRPTAGDSVIVFIVPGMTGTTGQYQPSYGAAPSASLHDISDPERRIVGILGTGQKLAYRVQPGKHEFMLASRTSTDFMEANVGPGKTYYVVLMLQGGGYDQRYGFKPVRAADFTEGRFARWDTNTSLVHRPDAWQSWNEANRRSIDERIRAEGPAWKKQEPAERRFRTLEVADGR